MTTPSLLPPLTPTSECVNNKITFSADEWRENAIKESRKPFRLIQNDILFIIWAARLQCQINHKTVGLTCVHCHQLSMLLFKHYGFSLLVSKSTGWLDSQHKRISKLRLLVVHCEINNC